MQKKKSNFKLGLYYNKEQLLPLSSVDLNIEIINKYVNVDIVQIYKNPFKQNINSTFFIPKECIPILKSLKIFYNNESYEGIVSHKSKNNIFYSEADSIEILEYNNYRKKYLFFDLKNIQPEQEVKIELNYIDAIDQENSSFKYVIKDIFIPRNNLEYKLRYNYNYHIKIKNTKKIKKIFCNVDNKEIKKNDDNEYIIKYSGMQKNENANRYKLIIEYEIEEKSDPDIIVMKHPLYKNDYACYFSLNLKNIIKENIEEEKEVNNKDEYIVIILNNSASDLKGIIESVVYLLKSLPEKNCKFNILQNKPFFTDFVDVNEDNIQKAIYLLETYDYYKDYVAFTINNIRLIEPKKNLINKVFIIGHELYSNINKTIKEIDKFSDSKCTFYTLLFPAIKDVLNFNFRTYKETLEDVKEISRRTKGNYALYNNKDEIPDKIIELYEESLGDYISNLSIIFSNEDKNLKIIKNEKYSIISKMDFLINMSMNNKITIGFDYKEKKYEYSYNICIDNAKEDDFLHKIFFYEYYKNNIFLEKELIHILNKYQILTNFNELYLEQINPEESLETKIDKKREKNLIFKPKMGIKMNLFMKDKSEEQNEIILYSHSTIKEAKIINDLITDKSYKDQRYIYYGKCMENNRKLEDFNVEEGTIIHVVFHGILFCLKSYFYVNESQNIYSIIKNQKINGFWEAHDDNIKLLSQSGIFFDKFYQKVKDIYSINDENIALTILCVSFLKSFPYKKRYHFILRKAINALKDKIDYNEEIQKKLDNFIY